MLFFGDKTASTDDAAGRLNEKILASSGEAEAPVKRREETIKRRRNKN